MFVSVTGIARRWLFQIVHNAKISFGLVPPQDDDFYYIIKQNIVWGLIFTQDAEVERTFIWNDPKDMFHWMNYLMERENINILHTCNHISEVPPAQKRPFVSFTRPVV